MATGKFRPDLRSPAENPEILRILQDHANDFMALSLLLNASGIEGVRETLRSGFKLATVEEYLTREENRDKIGAKEKSSGVFAVKAQKLDELAREINSSNGTIEEKRLREIIDEVKKIIYR